MAFLQAMVTTDADAFVAIVAESREKQRRSIEQSALQIATAVCDSALAQIKLADAAIEFIELCSKRADAIAEVEPLEANRFVANGLAGRHCAISRFRRRRRKN